MIAYTHNANTSILGESKTIPYSFYCGVHIRWLVSTIFGTEYIEIISNTKICLPHLLNVAALPWENLITTFELSDIVFSGIWVALKWASFEELRIWVEDTDLDDWGDHHLHCSHAGSQGFIFHQNGAPAHTAHTTQDWLQANCTGFIYKNPWP